MSEWIKSEIDASSLQGQDDCYPALKFQQGRWCPGFHLRLPWGAEMSTGAEPWGGCQQPLPGSCKPCCPWGSSLELTPHRSWDTTDTGASSPQPLLGAADEQQAESTAVVTLDQGNVCPSAIFFTFWSMGKIRSWLGLQWETSVHCKGPLKLNRWSRV